MLRKGRSSDSRRSADAFPPVAKNRQWLKMVRGAESAHSSGTVRGFAPGSLLFPDPAGQGNTFAETKIRQKNPDFKARGGKVFNILPKKRIPPAESISCFDRPRKGCRRIWSSRRPVLSLRPQKTGHTNMTRHLTHICRGTCSRQIDIDLDGETILNVRFTGGCHGKHTGRGRPRARHAPRRGHRPSRRHRLPRKRDLLPRPAGPGAEGGQGVAVLENDRARRLRTRQVRNLRSADRYPKFVRVCIFYGIC